MSRVRYYRPDPLGPLCPECMRPLHKGFECQEIHDMEMSGIGPAELGVPQCPRCTRHHYPSEECPLRQPEEEAAHQALLERSRR